MVDEQNFVLMRFDGVNLAFPSSNVLAVETLSKVRPDESHVPAVGILALDDQEFPVYALSKEFDCMNKPHEDRRLCVCLEMPNSSERYALACDSVEQHTVPTDMAAQELPEFMRMLRSPIRGLFRVENDLAAGAMNLLNNATRGGNVKVWIEDYPLSYDDAMKIYRDECK